MLYRKIGKEIEAHLVSSSDKILILEGARQIGKTTLVRQFGKENYENFVELNFISDKNAARIFEG